MGFDDGSLTLDSEYGAYYPGQTIKGMLKFTQDKVKTFRGIYVKIKGFCHVHWSTRHSRRIDGRTESYTRQHNSHEDYIDYKVYLIGGEHGECKLQPGKHEFPFECQIPGNCPPSFEGSHGHIRYELKVVVDRAFKLDQEKKRELRVVAPLDLNMEPNCKEPIAFDLQDTYCCFCVSSGSCDVVVKLPYSGYCPGQFIPIEVSCNNNSNIGINTIKMIIHKIVTFHAMHHPADKVSTEEVARTKVGPGPAHCSRNWKVDFEVPRMDVYNMANCGYIDIDYELEVKIDAEGCHNGNEQSTPIIIGNMPLKGFQDSVNPLLDIMPFLPISTDIQPSIIVNQGNLSNTPYGSPYPPNLGTGNLPYPGGNSPYPGGNVPYPGGNSPYPSGNIPYPGGNSPYPAGNLPYPTGASPNLGRVSPYPSGPYPPQNTNPTTVSPYPIDGRSSPYLGGNPIYPGGNPLYPGHSPNLSNSGKGSLKTGTFGFSVGTDNEASIPLLPAGSAVPLPMGVGTVPYNGATAPVESPSEEEKKPIIENNLADNPPPYNPDFLKSNTK